jgi:competence protein ComEA
MSFQSASKAHGVSNREAKGFLFLLFILITPFLLQYGYRALFYVPQQSSLLITYLTDTCEAKKEFQFVKRYSSNAHAYPKDIVASTHKKIDKAIAYGIVELNSADSTALESLPGIGPSFASRILKYRKLLGGYVDVEQLKEVYGMPEETYEKIKPLCRVDASKVTKFPSELVWENPYKIYHPYLTKELKLEIKQLKAVPYSVNDLTTLIHMHNHRFIQYIIF